MDAAVECTHCKVVMTSWKAAGSTVRYYQCPFCARTHSSYYGEVFRKRAGARVVEAPAASTPPGQIPMASAEAVRWAGVKQTAARWFARIEAESVASPEPVPRARVVKGPPPKAPHMPKLPRLDSPSAMVEIGARVRRKP
jgi:hypothetical protein